MISASKFLDLGGYFDTGIRVEIQKNLWSGVYISVTQTLWLQPQTLQNIYLFYFYFMCMDFRPMYMSVHYLHAWYTWNHDLRLPLIGVIYGNKAPCGFWERNLGPLKGKQTVLSHWAIFHCSYEWVYYTEYNSLSWSEASGIISSASYRHINCTTAIGQWAHLTWQIGILVYRVHCY